MKLMFALLSFSILFFCCNQSGSSHKKIKSILIVGNSIVKHAPNPEIGWLGDWGMAATSIDKDFVHIIQKRLTTNHLPIKLNFVNIADYEFNFPSYNLSRLDSLQGYDMIIMKIGENIDENKALDSNFTKHFSTILKKLDPNDSAIKILVDGFWDKPIVNGIIGHVAMEKGYPLVSITDLSRDSTNEVGSIYKNPAVAIHPSDKGMAKIAERIWDKMFLYLN